MAVDFDERGQQGMGFLNGLLCTDILVFCVDYLWIIVRFLSAV